MRKFLLATTAAAIALTFSGTISAQTDHSPFSLGKFVQHQSHGSLRPPGERTSSADQPANPAAELAAPSRSN